MGRGRPVNSQPGRLRYVAQASSPASAGSVPLPGAYGTISGFVNSLSIRAGKRQT
jgi:hypothetical protein